MARDSHALTMRARVYQPTRPTRPSMHPPPHCSHHADQQRAILFRRRSLPSRAAWGSGRRPPPSAAPPPPSLCLLGGPPRGAAPTSVRRSLARRSDCAQAPLAGGLARHRVARFRRGGRRAATGLAAVGIWAGLQPRSARGGSHAERKLPHCSPWRNMS
jgi:hypothetical protein